MQYGEVISLGHHRLMCGDATKSEDVEKLADGENVDLVLTDPPYGMKVQRKDGRIGGGKGGMLLTTKNDIRNQDFPTTTPYPLLIGDDSQESARKHYELLKDLCLDKKIIMWGGQYFAHFLPVNGGWIFWNKKTAGADFSDGELAYKSLGRAVKYYEHLWNGALRAGNTKLNLRHRVHPSQKPVELHAKILEDWSEPDNVILDCFGGSGTTLIAAEITGRKCLMMELSPEYCKIIKSRYEKITQQARIF